MKRDNYITVSLSDNELMMLNKIVVNSNGYLNKSSFVRLAIEAEYYHILKADDGRVMNALIEKHVGGAK